MKRGIILLFSLFLISALSNAQDYSSRTNMIDTWLPVQHQSDGADAIFIDDMNGDNSVAGLEARGWVVLDEDGGGSTPPWNQGDISVFVAYEGPDDGYTFTNYLGANGFLIDQWLISPPVDVTTGDTLSFWMRSPDGSSWDDSIYVRYSTTAGITPGDFDQTWGRYKSPTTGWERWTGTFNHTGTVRFAIQYYIFDGGPSGTYSDYLGIDYIQVISAAPPLITIAEAIEDLDNDFVPDHLGETVTVQGVVFSPNYQTTNNSYYIHDGTAGTDIFMFSPPLFMWAMGDELNITGVVSQYNGMTEIIPTDSSGWVLVGSGNPTPDPTVLTLAQYKANSEMYEGSLVGFVSLSLASGTWPGAGSSTNLSLTDGIDTVVFRIDSDTDIDGSPEPTWPVDVIGIGSQFDNSAPYDGGYQIFPRFYATDFLPPGTLPVELTSFSARVNKGKVYLDWTTATEVNNHGFEVQRGNYNEFRTLGFVQGHGTTTDMQNYSFIDDVNQTGTYYYRLKQLDFSGSFAYSEVIEVDVVAPVNFALGQNYPNPFNPSTSISFSLAVDSKVSLKIFDILGQEVTSLISGNLAAGIHEYKFNASDFNSGVYFYRIDAAGVDGTNFSSVKKMILTK